MKGAPDYASVVAEVLGARAYEDYHLSAGGTLPSETYSDIVLGTVPSGYEVIQSVNILSAKGCDTVHAMTLYVDTTVRRSGYFEVESAISFPRYYVATEGEVMTVRLINWDAVERNLLWFSSGILMSLGTPPLTPQFDAGTPPKLKKGDALWYIEDTIFGKRWLTLKAEKIPKGVTDIFLLPKLVIRKET